MSETIDSLGTKIDMVLTANTTSARENREEHTQFRETLTRHRVELSDLGTASETNAEGVSWLKKLVAMAAIALAGATAKMVWEATSGTARSDTAIVEQLTTLIQNMETEE